jgi:hypothetical protein
MELNEWTLIRTAIRSHPASDIHPILPISVKIP